ncbi:hypothetical protein [Maridesulfovibrio sp.]|uniref:hypothetical protein n=1 Tax=Maridesulfovibrio sp. TaxID=2795000 RepID=UPI003B00FF47
MRKVIPFPVESQSIPPCSGRSMPMSEAGEAINRFCRQLMESHGDRSVLLIQSEGEIRIKMRRGKHV